LLDHDIVNLRVAHQAGLPAVVVGDIDKGGVFAALYGTVELLPPEYRQLVGGFIINKLRGDPSLLGDATKDLEGRCGVPTLDGLRGRGLDRAVLDSDSLVLGVCGGYQMMGRLIDDAVESERGMVTGLGWLDVTTTFDPEKLTRQRRGAAMGQRITGYQIHHG